MKSKTFVLSLLMFLAHLTSTAFKLESSYSDSLKPLRTVEQDDTGITVSYVFPGAIVTQDNLYPDAMNLDIPGFGVNSEPEEAAWPFRIESFEIPQSCEAELSVISCNWSVLDLTLSPARPLLVDSSDDSYSLDNVPPIRNIDQAYPKEPVSIADIQVYRDRNILSIYITPLRYKNFSQTEVCEELSFHISFKASKSGIMKKSGGIIHDVDDDFMSSLFTTHLPDEDEILMKEYSSQKWTKAPYYLILSIPAYRSYVEDFISWKKCMGYNVDAIYSNSWTTSTIKSKIESIYKSISSLDYVLLIGDAQSIPPVLFASSSKFPHDHYSDYTYGCMDGVEDEEQDVIIGRLNVSNAAEASTVINKIINYEKNPPLNNSFYKNSIHATFFQDKYNPKNYEDRRFTRTCEDIRNGLQEEQFSIKRIYYALSDVTPTNWNKGTYAYGENLPTELLKPNFNWDGSNTDVINSINSGSFYVLHRGHGSYKGWADPSFTISSLDNLSNGSLLPVFFNIHCQSGAFGKTQISDGATSIDLSFSEALLRKSNGGAVGVFAATENSYSGPNDALIMEMFQCIWPKTSIVTDFPNYSSNGEYYTVTPIYALGKILKRGMSGLSSKYKGSLIQYTKQLFHCFGDPSMQLYTALPHKINLFSVSDNPYAIRAKESITMSIVLKDGSVLISNGTYFDLSDYVSDIDKISYFGHNVIPTVTEIKNISKIITNNSKITNIKVNNGEIELEYDVNTQDNVIIRIRPVNSTLNIIKDISSSGGFETISMRNFDKGVYIIELIEDGILADYKKVSI